MAVVPSELLDADVPFPAKLPRGWRQCKRCELAVPVRETWCSLCLWDRMVESKAQGWRCEMCGAPMTGRRLHARYCGGRCTQRAKYARWVALGRPRRDGRPVMLGGPGRGRPARPRRLEALPGGLALPVR